MNHVLNWDALPKESWESCLETALRCGHDRAIGRGVATGHSLGMLFFNPSLRTRTSMELAAAELGAHPTTLTPGQGVWNFAWERGVRMDGAESEHIQEAIGVLSRYYDALGVRLFASMTDRESDRSDSRLTQIVQAAGVPVINLESARFHPCQALADAAVMTARFGDRIAQKKFVLSWAPHPRALPMAVPNSALLAAARLGMDVTVASPKTHRLDADVVEMARSYGVNVCETDDQNAAADGADIIYAKAWGGSMGYDEPDREEMIRMSNADWKIDSVLMDTTNEAGFMHCLPVRRNVVVDDGVLGGPRALHLDQAEYRIHAQKAILAHVWDLNLGAEAGSTAGTSVTEACHG